MKHFQKILVPVDFAPHSQEAVQQAVDIAQHYGASITLVYVYEPADYALPEGYVLYTPEQIGLMTTEFEARLRAARRDVEALGISRVETRLLNGAAASEIVAFAEDEGIDLIVMGTHGRTGLKHMLMGSVAERVLRTAPCPVLTTKAPDKRQDKDTAHRAA
jgi:nucleotide-binding universal stress UspA family protein